MKIHLQRVYEFDPESHESCFLIDRLWPRGISKKALNHVTWLKDIAPSAELRKWFNHDVERWEEFRKRYLAELRSLDEPVQTLRHALKKGAITLLYAAKDEKHNHALVLRDFLMKHRG